MEEARLRELLIQSLVHEEGGVQVYEAALDCVIHEDLRGEWQEYLDQTLEHVRLLTDVCRKMGVEVDRSTPGCRVVQHLGASLVRAIDMARAAKAPGAAQLVACECVVLAETKDHANWELLTKCSEELASDRGEALRAAVEEIEDEEDEHLYHTKGWCRELWLDSLAIKAVLPPPEDRKDVKTAIGAARAEQARDRMR